MKASIILLLIIYSLPNPVFCQNELQIDDYDMGSKELVVFPFGMEQRIKIGNADRDGNLVFHWPKLDLDTINNTNIFLTDVKSALECYCDEEQIEEQVADDLMAAKAGVLYLWNDVHWVGAVTPASDNLLNDHLLDNYGIDAVEGSYLEWVYANASGILKSTCLLEQTCGGSETVQIKKAYNIDLQEGWNMILTRIKKVATVKDAANVPVDIEITSIDQIPDEMHWYLKRF